MSSRELHQLEADNQAWLQRPENRGQTILLDRLRSQRRSNTETRGTTTRDITRGRRRAAPQSSRERSRSPLLSSSRQPSQASGESSRPERRPAMSPHIFNILIRLQGMGVMSNQRPLIQTPGNVPIRREPHPNRRMQQIATLPTHSVTAAESDSCSICLNEYETKEKVTELPCRHIFHPSCIAQWLHHNPRCPLCRSRCFQ